MTELRDAAQQFQELLDSQKKKDEPKVTRRGTRPEPEAQVLDPSRITTVDESMFDVQLPGGIGLTGMGGQVERDPFYAIDRDKVLPNVSMAEVYDFSNPETVAMINRATIGIDGRGNPISLKPEDSLAQRVDRLDKFGAEKIVVDDIELQIPFYKKIMEAYQPPENLNTGVLKNGLQINTSDMTPSDLERVRFATMMTSANLSNPKVGRPLYAGYLNNLLIQQGVGQRGRLTIIRDRLDDPTMGDLENIVMGTGEILGRGTIEAGLYLVGETLDWFDGNITGQDRDSITHFSGRQKVIDDIWPTLGQSLQDRYAKKGIVIDIETANRLGYTYTGLLPRATRLAAEIVAPSRATFAARAGMSARELALFETFAANELRIDADRTADELFESFVKLRQKNVSGPIVDAVPFLGRALTGTYYSKSNIESRLALAYQIADTKLEPKFRAEVAGVRGVLAEQYVALRSLRRSQAKNPSEIRVQEIAALQDKINENKNTMNLAERNSAVPKELRDLKVQDYYMLTGAAAFEHFFGAEFEMVDPALASLIGLFTGFTVSTAKGSTPRGLRAIKSMALRGGFGDNRKRLEFFVTEMSKQNPGYQRMIEGNAARLMVHFDKLEAQGIDRKYLEAALPVVTDLVTLRHFANTLRQGLAAGEIFDPKVVEAFQESELTLRELNGELNRLIEDMGADVVQGPQQAGQSPDSANMFFTFMRSMSKQGEDLRGQLETDIKTITEEGLDHYLNSLTLNRKVVDPDGIMAMDESQTTVPFNIAVRNLMERELFVENAIDEEAYKRLSEGALTSISLAIAQRGNTLIQQIGAPAVPRKEILINDPDGAKAADIPLTADAGTLFAFSLEGLHEVRYADATRPYRLLKTKAVYSTATGPLQGKPTVNAFSVIRDFNSTVGSVLTGKGASGGLVDELIVELSEPIFIQLAQQSGRTLDDVYKQLRKSLETDPDNPVVFNKKRSVPAQIALALQELDADDADALSLFDMSPDGLAKLDQIVLQQAHKFNQKGDGAAAGLMYDLSSKSIQPKFEQFSVDGVPIGQLFVKIGDNAPESFVEYLRGANQNYRQYKEDFHDRVGGSFIQQRLFNGRVSVQEAVPSARFPTGQETKKLPSEWLTLKTLTDPEQSTQYIQAMHDAGGQLVLLPGDTKPTRRLVQGTPFAESQKVIVQVALAQEVDRLRKAGTLNEVEINKIAKTIDENIKVVEMAPDGSVTEVPLVNFPNLIDDVTKFNEKNVGTAVHSEAIKEANKLIDDQLAAAVEPARQLKEGLQDALGVVGRLTSDNQRASDIADVLIEGGMDRYTTIKSSMLKLANADGTQKYTSQDVDNILRAAYLQGIRRRVFTKTGAKLAKVDQSLDGKVSTTFTDLLVENPQELIKYLGETPGEAATARAILGNENYEVMEAIAGVLVELQDNPLAQLNSGKVNVRGIPRALSVESYISRIYAINRGVVRPQYVGTEAVLQQLRFSNHEFLTAVLTDPQLGRDFIELVRTGKPLAPERNARFTEALVQHFALSSRVDEPQKKKVIDAADRTFTVSATPMDKLSAGFPPDTAAGQPLNIPDAPTGTLTGPMGTGLPITIP